MKLTYSLHSVGVKVNFELIHVSTLIQLQQQGDNQVKSCNRTFFIYCSSIVYTTTSLTLAVNHFIGLFVTHCSKFIALLLSYIKLFLPLQANCIYVQQLDMIINLFTNYLDKLQYSFIQYTDNVVNIVIDNVARNNTKQCSRQNEI